METYRASEGLSKHEFDNFLIAPAYYKWKKTKEWKPSREMILGTLIHSLALEDRTDFAVGPNVDKRTKAGKEEWQAFCEENIGKEIITQEEEFRVMSATAKVYCLFKSAAVTIDQVEASMFWERSGVQCKGRPDLIGTYSGNPCIIDLKTTSDFNKFDQKFFSFGYDIQAAWYRRGLMEITSKETEFWFLVVDTEEPFFCQWVLLSGEAINKADERIDEGLEQFELCQQKNSWPEPAPVRVMMPRSY